ncbi:DUF4913 domain-containing protein [Nocardia sp. NPDC052566]|uniref:DUF4913 domain-containing protein n=1 Tax=Nocardia sp. NPDC052566 TaxID=3364330 RepID=UPI0037C930DB
MTSTAATSPAASGGKGAPMPPQYRHFVPFALNWLLPTLSVRLGEANREDTYTWCLQWWAHRAVAVRIAHLHNAFEAARRARGTSVSTFLSTHVDGHARTILDAANGPLHRCTRELHVPTPSLRSEPVPPGWFMRRPQPDRPGSGNTKAPPPRFAHFEDFVQQWLLPVTSVRIAANSREGQYTWCTRWFEHLGVCVRFAALHRGFEAARIADDKTAMSSLFISHIDPHMRHILDAAKGPLHKCTPTQHIPLPGLASAEIPLGWFGLPGTTTAVEDLGFGPDFRAFTPTGR